MPLKEFECQACTHRFEVVLWISDPNPAACPKCGKGELKQLLSTFRIAGVRSKSAATEDFGGGDGADLGDMGGGDGDWGDDGGGDLGAPPEDPGEESAGSDELAGEDSST